VKAVAVVVNPISGSGAKARALAEFRAVLEAAGAEVRVRPTRGPGDGGEIAKEEAARGAGVVVAAGGDGTVNDVARGLVACGEGAPALAVLPRGTSNLVARDLGLPFSARENARVVLEGRTEPMDVGVANGRVFVACAGVGWDAHVVRLLSNARKGHIRFSTYAKPIAQALFEYKFEPMRVVAADGTCAEGVFAMIFNTRPYAAFFTPAPGARRDDGVLDAIVLARGGALDLLRWSWKGLRGTLSTDVSATALRSTSFRVEAAAPLPVQIDGDVGGETPLDILVRPAAIRIVVPAPGKERTRRDR
jgi:YegS/Rv2252/BmrU family lipid kinase